jgi:glutamate/aspartate transport system substrate-binding protein
MNGQLRKAGLACVIGAFSLGAYAEGLSGNLEKIKSSGVITLGVQTASVPFSYEDGHGSYQGYSVDLCMKAADAVKSYLGLDTLAVKMRPVNATTRIDLVRNGEIDLSCDAPTNNVERGKLVSFLPTMYVASNRWVSKKAANLHTLDDLRGKRVTSAPGTTAMKLIRELNDTQHLNLTIIEAKSHPGAFEQVVNGEVDAYVMDDILLAGIVAVSQSPRDYEISMQSLSVEPYGIIERRDDPAFKKVVDNALEHVYQSGEGERIYNKWFLSPIPPSGIVINVPLSPALREAFVHPTDSPDPALYTSHTTQAAIN